MSTGNAPDGPDAAALGRTLATLDALAPRLIARAAPLRFGLAASTAERDAVYRLRCRVVVERGWGPPEACPDGRERDAFDDRALHVVAWDGAALVGANRLVLPVPGRPLPTEAAFGVTVEPAGRVVDWSRTVAARGRAGRGHGVLLGLIGRSWQETRARGYDRICGDFAAPVVRLYRAIGVRVELLGPARSFWGQERYPIRVDLEATAAALAAWLDR